MSYFVVSESESIFGSSDFIKLKIYSINSVLLIFAFRYSKKLESSSIPTSSKVSSSSAYYLRLLSTTTLVF